MAKNLMIACDQRKDSDGFVLKFIDECYRQITGEISASEYEVYFGGYRPVVSFDLFTSFVSDELGDYLSDYLSDIYENNGFLDMFERLSSGIINNDDLMFIGESSIKIEDGVVIIEPTVVASSLLILNYSFWDAVCEEYRSPAQLFLFTCDKEGGLLKNGILGER